MNSYLIMKLVHVVAVIIFMGNIYTGLFWMSQATKSRDPKIIIHTIAGIIKSDKWFTIPGVIIITAGGILSAVHGGIPLLKTGWIFWSIVLFTISGIAFMWKVAPLQKKIYRLVNDFDKNDEQDFWKGYHNLNKQWERWGGVALITPVIAMCMMILKYPATTFFLK